MTSRPRLLFISPRFLFPLDQGGKIRTANTLRGMKGGAFDITLASPAPAPDAYAADIATICDRFISWPERHFSLLAKLLLLPGRLPVAVATDRSAEGARIVAAALGEKPDVLVVDFPHAAVLAPPPYRVPSVMFTHNIEAEIFERHAAVNALHQRLVYSDQARKMRRFEGDVLRTFDRVIAVSARDAKGLASQFGLKTVDVIDTGVDLDFYAFTPPPAAPVVVFSGVMDGRANIDGVDYLMDEIWPLMAARRPDLKALMVGRNPPPTMIAKAEKRGLPWTFTGFVEDIRPHVAAGAVSIIPLRVGSGTRIKAFEAMALGRPVVSTTIGVEGLDITPGEHFLAADTAADFADAVLRLIDDPALANRLAIAARARLEEKFSWSVVARQFESICQRAMDHRAN